jgi:hypothetical protein
VVSGVVTHTSIGPIVVRIQSVKFWFRRRGLSDNRATPQARADDPLGCNGHLHSGHQGNDKHLKATTGPRASRICLHRQEQVLSVRYGNLRKVTEGST